MAKVLITFFNVVAANTAPAAEVGLGTEAVEEVEAVEALDVPGRSPTEFLRPGH